MKNFGINRVVEPKGTVPVTAWKLDNSREIGDEEIRISVRRIHVEMDGFQQICASCGYDDERIKARIMEIVEKRGKLHNPYTGSGGVLLGTIDAVGSKLADQCEYKPGDQVYCLTTLMAVPLWLQEVTEIDYDHGQIEAKGYGIFFQPDHFIGVEPGIRHSYTMMSIDEAGNFYRTYRLAKEKKTRNITILARDLFTPLIYVEAVKKALRADGDGLSVIAILDQSAFPDADREQLGKLLSPEIGEVYLVDESQPLKSYEELCNDNPANRERDMIIVGEDVRGAETLAVFLVKEGGDLFFSSIKSNYAQGVFVAEVMDKTVFAHYFDQYMGEKQNFTMEIIRRIHQRLEKVEDSYRRQRKKGRASRGKTHSRALEQMERINDFIFQSPVTREMVVDALNVARYDCNVIIQGETGVGKEKVLELIHHHSQRQTKPCIKINCATIQENLAEAEFFGYEKGAFTGAQSQGKEGYFELANNGTLFLDEIGALSLTMQSKLLRVLQENQYYRVGGTEQKSVDVRVICANNVPLKQLVEEGLFREDLYYRLNICMINVPPLRERKEDIVCLAEAFLANYNRKYGISRELAPQALQLLQDYHWPGNVRELENVVQRLIINSGETIIDEGMVDQILNYAVYEETVIDVQKEFHREESLDFKEVLEQQEKRLIQYALKKEGTTRKAAEFLRLPQATLARKKTRYGL